MIRGLFAALVLALPAVPAAVAQQLEGAAVAQQLSYRFSDSTGAGRQSGTLLGITAGVGFKRFHFGLRGSFGQVSDPEKAFVVRDLRTTTINAGLYLADWIETGLEIQARYESRNDLKTLQRLGGPFARAVADFGGTGLQGLAELALFPLTSSHNTPEVSLALRAAIGVRYEQLTGPLTFQVAYRLSRVDYRETGGTTPRTPIGSCTEASHASGSTHLKTSRVWASQDHRRFMASSSSASSSGGSDGRTVKLRRAFIPADPIEPRVTDSREARTKRSLHVPHRRPKRGPREPSLGWPDAPHRPP